MGALLVQLAIGGLLILGLETLHVPLGCINQQRGNLVDVQVGIELNAVVAQHGNDKQGPYKIPESGEPVQRTSKSPYKTPESGEPVQRTSKGPTRPPKAVSLCKERARALQNPRKR